MYRDFVTNLVKNHPRNFTRMLSTDKNKKIIEDVEQKSSHIKTNSLSEKIFIYINFLQEKPKCVFCGLNECRYKNVFLGYFDCCSINRSNKLIPLQRKEKDPDTFTKSRTQQHKTMINTINACGKTLLEARVEKFKNTITTKDEQGSTIAERSGIKNKQHWENNKHPRKNKSYEEIHGDKAEQVRDNVAKGTREGMLRVGDDGLSVAQRVNRKRVVTMRNDVNENGVNAIQRATRSGGKKISKKMRELYNNLAHDVSDTKSFLYVLYFEEREIFKIGWTSNLSRRKKDLERSLNTTLKIVKVISGKYRDIRAEENNLHELFDNYNLVLDEKILGRTEWFNKDCLEECLKRIHDFEKSIL